MQIEAGKFYKTRDGRKVGPASRGWSSYFGLQAWWLDGVSYNDYGGQTGEERENDLIEEWTEPTATPAPAGPVRMVRQIVPGVYAGFEVGAHEAGRLYVLQCLNKMYTADELRSAAMVFSQLAEALDDQP